MMRAAASLGAPATLRLTLIGASGRLDVAAPGSALVRDLAEQYAAQLATHTADPSTRTPRVPDLATAWGQVVAADETLVGARLEDGQLLTVVPGDQSSAAPGAGPAPAVTAPLSQQALAPRSVALPLAATCATGAAVTIGLEPTSAPTTVWAAAALLGAGMLATMPIRGLVGSPAARSVIAPLLGAAGGFVLGVRPGPSGVLLGIAVAALVGTATAAIDRLFSAEDEDGLNAVVLAVGGIATLLSGGLVLAGGSPSALAALAFAAAVVAARLLPHLVVDVADEALLDLDRLAVTAWSAREGRRRGGRRRSLVRPDLVADVVRRGQRQVAAATVACAVLATATGALLVRSSVVGELRAIGITVMVASGGVAMTLMARSVRAHVDRMALRLSGTLLLAVVALNLVATLDDPGRWAVAVSVGVAAVWTVTAAIALGRGWRSVWWARVGDLLEGVSLALTLGSCVLACGLFDLVRGFVG